MAIRTDAQNIGFSIPIDTAREAANSILVHRPIARPYLGISMIDLDAEMAKSLGVPSTHEGVLVSKVTPQSPADSSGLEEGDLIQKVNATPVRTGHDVQTIVREQKIGNQINMEVFHSGKIKHVSVKVSQYPNDTADVS
jgi:S1-C subfamily serine protease